MRSVEHVSTSDDMTTPDSPPPDALAAGVREESPPAPSGPGDLFIAFSQLSLAGFGGVMPFAYRDLVERRKWIDAREFAGLLAIAQVMPGPTICNLSVMYGQRIAGLAGATAALSGLVLGPMFLVIGLAVLWTRYGAIPAVNEALGGMSAIAIGLIAGTGVKMGIGLFKREARRDGPHASYWRVIQAGLCVLAFVGVGVMRWPLVEVVVGLAPIAIAIAWFTEKK
jgi:chromate transporter